MIWVCFHLATGHFLLWAREVGANPWVSWEKKQFHIDNAATLKLHLAFADKSVPVTKEFSTPQAICTVHWTSESQQAPRHTQGIFLFRVEGWGNHSAGWAKRSEWVHYRKDRVFGMGMVTICRPQGESISLTCDQLVVKIQIPVCKFFQYYVSSLFARGDIDKKTWS